MKKALAVITLFHSLSSHAGIDHIEPPHWWVGMHNARLQLMVHGDNIGQFEPELQRSDVRIESVERTDNPNYLFINLSIPAGTQAQDVALNFRYTDGSLVQRTYTLKARKPESATRRGFDQSDLIYLAMPDRFANGDPSNDTNKALGDAPNREDPYGRHGGDLQGLTQHLDYLAGLGVTQLWLNPVLENKRPASSYHGYAISDLYQVDPRLGGNAAYLQLSAAAAIKGIGLIADLIPNHIGNGHWWMQDLPAKNWLNGAAFHPTSHMRESLQDPYAVESDKQAMERGWFVPSMPDLNQRNPLLANYLIQNAIWWIEEAGLSGLRIDTWPYSDKQFLQDWSKKILAEYPNLNMVGEEWSLDPAIIAYWQAGKTNWDGYQNQLPSLFDFPLQNEMVAALKENESWNSGMIKLYRALARDALYAAPEKLTIFTDNHDMSRIHTQLDHDPALTRMALALTATLRGTPQVLYGAEILMSNPGTDSHGVIRTEYPGGWPDHQVNAFTGKGLSPEQKQTQTYFRNLFNWRKTATAIHHGRTQHLAPKDGIYAFARFTDQERWLILVNKNPQSQSLDSHWLNPLLGGGSRLTEALSQQSLKLKNTLTVPGKQVTIYRVEK